MIRSFALFVITTILIGCGSSGRLGTIGNETVTLEEFEEMYAKNNGGWERAALSKPEDRKAFLDLFVKYKLKLQEARARGLLRDSAVQNELAAYRASVAATYMINKEVVEPSLRRLYNRKKEEIRASHILIRVDQNAAPEDTLDAYNQAVELLARAHTIAFDSLAKHFSQDPSAVNNGGDLGWFSQGRMVRPFEEAAYALQPGELTPVPVRTQFGYHIIKVTGRQPSKGSVQISHILRRFAPAFADTTQVRDTVMMVYDSIRTSALSFEEAVIRYSDDPSSKARQGLIGDYDRTRLPPDIAKVVFSTPAGTVAPPYRASYGYHIFKVNSVQPVPSFEELEKELRQYYQQAYYASDYEQYLHDLKKKYNLNFDVKLRFDLTHSFDSTKSPAHGDWNAQVKPEWYGSSLCIFGGTSLTVGQFVSHVQHSDEFKTQPLTTSNVDEIIDRVVTSRLLEHHASNAGDRHPEFAELMKEYENGVLIYRLDQDEIWNKIQPADSLLREYYESNKAKYRWPDRLNMAEIHVRTDSAANRLYQRALSGEDFGDLAAEATIRPGFKEKRGEWGFLPVQSSSMMGTASTMAVDSISAPFKYENGWSVIKVLAKDPARIKTFEEALPEVTSHYQDHASKEREREWIETLKQRYGVDIDPEKLSDAFKSRPAS